MPLTDEMISQLTGRELDQAVAQELFAWTSFYEHLGNLYGTVGPHTYIVPFYHSDESLAAQVRDKVQIRKWKRWTADWEPEFYCLVVNDDDSDPPLLAKGKTLAEVSCRLALKIAMRTKGKE